ncbi:MAG: phosphatase PAP2 family protein [Terracidiphilus sp.]
MLLIFDIIGCAVTRVVVPGLAGILTAFILVVAGVQVLPAYWHSKGRKELRDAALTLPWLALFVVLLPYPIDIATKLGSHLPLQDASFARIDTWLGINVPSIAHWASANPIGLWVTKSYGALVPLMYLSLFLPALTGETERAQQFVTANFLMVLVGIPILAFLPAVGPWYGFHTAAYPAEIQAQSDLFSLRQSGQFGLYIHHYAAVVCFPSGHVMGAIFAAYSLWIYRYIRIPLVLLSASIILSTMTTGWHYFFDVLGGLVEGFLLILLVRWLSRKRRLMANPSLTRNGAACV